jgi:general secretion pathway protein M
MMVLSTSVRRTLALALLLLALLGSWSVLVAPVINIMRNGGQSLADARELLGRYRAIAQTREAALAQEQVLRRQASAGRLVLEGANEQLAAADLQARLKRLIESNGAVMKSTQILPPREEGNFRRVILRVAMETNIEGLQKIFHTLEMTNPLLFVDNIEIRSRQLQDTKPAQRHLADLMVNYDVYGYLHATTP